MFPIPEKLFDEKGLDSIEWGRILLYSAECHTLTFFQREFMKRSYD
jgi:hypothetical protein